MTRSISVQLLSSAAALALGAALLACSVEDDGGRGTADASRDARDTAQDRPPDLEAGADASDASDADGASSADVPDSVPDGSQQVEYRYVLIYDLDRDPSGDRPGAEIDGVELDHGDAFAYLSQVLEANYGAERPSGENANFSNALGVPEEQCVDRDPRDWDSRTFVSLGGIGGYIIGSFDASTPIESGDQITVYACAGPLSEPWQLSVGVGTTLSDPSWFQVIDNGVMTATVTVPFLPPVSE